jgi:hypothetical protein
VPALGTWPSVEAGRLRGAVLRVARFFFVLTRFFAADFVVRTD